MNNIDAIIREFSEKLEIKKPQMVLDKDIEKINRLITGAPISSEVFRDLTILSYKIEENGFKVIEDILNISLPIIHSKEEIAEKIMNDLLEGKNYLETFKSELFKQLKTGVNISANLDVNESELSNELMQYLLNPNVDLKLDFCQHIYSQAINKHLEIRKQELINDSIEEVFEGHFFSIKVLSTDIKVAIESSDYQGKVKFALDQFWNQWEEDFKSEFYNKFLTNLGHSSKIISEDLLLVPLLNKALKNDNVANSVENLKLNFEQETIEYEKEVVEIGILNSFEKYVQQIILNFKDNNLSYIDLLKDIDGMTKDQLKKTISEYVHLNLIQPLNEGLSDFFNKRKVIKMRGLIVWGDREFLNEFDKHLSLAGWNYVVNKLVSLKKEAQDLNKKESVNEFLNQYHFVFMQEFYLEKVCLLLGVDRNIIKLNSELKNSGIELLESSFAIAHISQKVNGIYPMSFRRLSQYVNNKVDMSEQALVTFLLHEVTHIKQMEDKRLNYQYVGLKNRLFWEGEDYTDHKLLSSDSYEAYLSLPWEVEARASEYMVSEILDQVNKESPLVDPLITLVK